MISYKKKIGAPKNFRHQKSVLMAADRRESFHCARPAEARSAFQFFVPRTRPPFRRSAHRVSRSRKHNVGE